MIRSIGPTCLKLHGVHSFELFFQEALDGAMLLQQTLAVELARLNRNSKRRATASCVRSSSATSPPVDTRHTRTHSCASQNETHIHTHATRMHTGDVNDVDKCRFQVCHKQVPHAVCERTRTNEQQSCTRQTPNIVKFPITAVAPTLLISLENLLKNRTENIF